MCAACWLWRKAKAGAQEQQHKQQQCAVAWSKAEASRRGKATYKCQKFIDFTSGIILQFCSLFRWIFLALDVVSLLLPSAGPLLHTYCLNSQPANDALDKLNCCEFRKVIIFSNCPGFQSRWNGFCPLYLQLPFECFIFHYAYLKFYKDLRWEPFHFP